MWISFCYIFNSRSSIQVCDIFIQCINIEFCIEFVQIFIQHALFVIVDRKHQQVKHLLFMNGMPNSHQVRKISSGKNKIPSVKTNFSPFFSRKNIPMTEVNYWFRLVIVNIVCRILNR
jgi:hypothetical protein